MSNIKILGDSNRKSRFNRDLADRVNIDVEKRIREEERELKKKTSDNKVLEYISENNSESQEKFDRNKSLILENISCVDADGNVFEQYDKLLVAQDVVRTGRQYSTYTQEMQHQEFLSYDAIRYFENDNPKIFLPSFALTCNILHQLYRTRHVPLVALSLDKYRERGDGFGVHMQNTIVDWNKSKIIHYPENTDYPVSAGPFLPINVFRPKKEYKFNPVNLDLGDEIELTDIFDDDEYSKFIKNLTGLREPRVLVDIINFLGCRPKTDLRLMLYTPDNPWEAQSINSTSIGCNSYKLVGQNTAFDFTLNTSDEVYSAEETSGAAARGVALVDLDKSNRTGKKGHR